MKNFEQLLALAVTDGLIDKSTQEELLQLWNLEYPNSDLIKEDLFEKFKKAELENSLQYVMTFNEANTMYGIGSTTLRKNVSYGRYLDGEVKKSGGTWLITPGAIKRLYPEKFINNNKRK